MTRLRTSALALALAAAAALPQAARAEDDAQVWSSISISAPIAGRLTGSFDANTRAYDNASYVGHAQARGFLGWKFSPNFTLGGGYSYVRSENVAGVVSHENRIFQQASYALANWDGIKLTGRTRLEQRMFSNSDGTSHRLRQQIKLTIPLEGPDGLHAIAHTEGYFQLNEKPEGTSKGLSQIRTFAGLGIPLVKHLVLEAGYLNQAVVAGDKRMNHVLSLGLVVAY